MKKKALITGVTGQDGSYLAELLIKKNYIVHGIKRRSSSINTARIDHLFNNKKIQNKKLFLHYGDLTDSSNVYELIKKIRPDEIYNLAAQSHVAVSFQMPEYTAQVNAIGALRILEAIKNLNFINKTKFYQASTSEMFGMVQDIPQTEKTPFYPRSPYAISKLFAYWTTINYREAYGIYACNGILFNHESPRRGETFVTRKISLGLVSIVKGKNSELLLGNLDSKRDWGHTKDSVEMQWLMMQQKRPDDYVISTGQQYTVRDFIKWSCEFLGFKIKFKGKGVNEIGVIDNIFLDNKFKIKEGDIIIKVHKKYFRPTEVSTLLGNSAKAQNKLGWKPKFTAKQLCKEMILSDLQSQ
tara:strand:- start:123 stop:1187 length:1065 start_codon:yes stop_codon:yes gene_type:complete